MARAAIIILTGTESHADHGRLANGLEAAAEFAASDDELVVVFDGAGTQWVPKLEEPDSDYHDLYQQIQADAVVCDFCASAFEVADAVADSGLERVIDFDGHPSVRDLVADGYEVITY